MKINPKYDKDESEIIDLIHNYSDYIEDDSLFVSYAHKIIIDKSNYNLDELYLLLNKNLYSEQEYYKKFKWTTRYFSGVINSIVQRLAVLDNFKDKSKRILELKEWGNKFFSL